MAVPLMQSRGPLRPTGAITQIETSPRTLTPEPPAIVRDADRIRAFAAWEIINIPDRDPDYTLRRIRILLKVSKEYGHAGLYETPPEEIARKESPGRASSNRLTRAAWKVRSTLEDFRDWESRST
jgi:hypothetical protein